MGNRRRELNYRSRTIVGPTSEMILDVEFTDADKMIVIIETPPSMQPFKQVTCLMTQEELDEGKKERPDLIFRIPEDMSVEKTMQQGPMPIEGESVHGMTEAVLERYLNGEFDEK